jgi:hypothetical protein
MVDLFGSAEEFLLDTKPINERTAAHGTVFSAVEKPLIFEFSAMGLSEGSSILNFRGKFVHTWDNVHWWGANPGKFPATPGAFHACHLHWRWGHVVRIASWHEQPQFYKSGVKIPSYGSFYGISGIKPGGLVDPKCWIQSIRISIICLDRLPENWDEYPQLSLGNLNNNPEPKVISSADLSPLEDICLIASVKINHSRQIQSLNDETATTSNGRVIYSEISGTVFIHGLFFGHEAQTYSIFTVGSEGPQFWPLGYHILSRLPRWERY